jgi:hypothetical protein
MNEFISTNPAIATWLIGILASLVCFLVYGVLFFVKRSFDSLTRAITSMEKKFDEGQIAVGSLKDRMAKQETTCSMQRSLCPNRSIFPEGNFNMHQEVSP